MALVDMKLSEAEAGRSVPSLSDGENDALHAV
jgi:hypothetical protein